MLYDIHDENKMRFANENLEKIIEAFREFSEESNKYKTEFQSILKEMEDFKKLLAISKENGHYIDCVWSNPKTKCGPDTCRCRFRYWKPE